MTPDFDSVFDLTPLADAQSVAVVSPRPEDEVMLLFNQLRDPLLRYALSFGIGVSEGEDLIQDAFLSLFRHLRLGRSRSNLRGWLFRVAHNLALKRRGAWTRLHPLADEITESIPDADPSPEERLVDNERRTLLLSVLNALPEMDQNCLRLRAEGLRCREIASVLGISLGAVSNSLARSFEKLNRAGRR